MYYWNGTAWEAVGPEVPQSPIAYQASAPSTPSTGDLWIDSDQDLETYQRQLVRYKFIASGGETSLSGADANGATLSYTPGAEQVYLNGALLVRGSDYVATNGTSITSLAALSVNDVVEIFAYVAFNVANTYTQSQVDGLVGLVHINTTSFSGVASQSINDVFSSTYDNYKVITIVNNSTTSAIGLSLRLRNSGTDNSANNYRWSGTSTLDNSATPTPSGSGSNGLTSSFNIGASSSVAGFTGHIITEITNPFETIHTTESSLSVFYDQTATRGATALRSGLISVTTSYDGFTIFPASGTITGTVTIYGYKK